MISLNSREHPSKHPSNSNNYNKTRGIVYFLAIQFYFQFLSSHPNQKNLDELN